MQKTKIDYPFFPLLGTVLFLTLFAAGTSLWLSTVSESDLSSQQIRVFNLSTMVWQMGSWQIVGLLGGKAAVVIGSEEDK